MKIQPVDAVDSITHIPVPVVRPESAKPVLKSRLKRLFDRQLPSVLRISTATAVDKPTSEAAATQYYGSKGGEAEFEPSSVCLAKLVLNYIEDSNINEKPLRGAGRHRCNCFNGSTNDSSDDEFDVFGFGEPTITAAAPASDPFDNLKSLVACASPAERAILADTAKIMEKNKNLKSKPDLRKIVADGLQSLGHDSSICLSKWDKSPSYPAAGEYEYVDVIVEGERVLIDVDFRSEFEIARPTVAYKWILQSLPFVFVGKPDRLGQIVSAVSEAAKQSLKKRGMPIPPWRKAEYMRAKWLAPFSRLNDDVPEPPNAAETGQHQESTDDCGELELIFGETRSPLSEKDLSSFSSSSLSSPAASGNSGEGVGEIKGEWQPPAVNPKSLQRGAKMVTGLASLLKEKP